MKRDERHTLHLDSITGTVIVAIAVVGTGFEVSVVVPIVPGITAGGFVGITVGTSALVAGVVHSVNSVS